MIRRSILLLLLHVALAPPVEAFHSEPGWWPELVMLYASDLAIDADLVRQDEEHFWVRVRTVLRDTAYGIKAGDHIRVDRTSAYDCGWPWRPEVHRRWRLYLHKDPGKGNWSLLEHSADRAIGISTDRTVIFMPKDIWLPVDEFDRCLLEFQTCYAMDGGDHSFHAVTSVERIDSLAGSNPIIAEFERIGRAFKVDEILEPPPLPPPAPDPIAECPFLEEEPGFAEGSGPDAFKAFTKEHLRYPVDAGDKEGHVYIRVLITEEGLTAGVEVLRGLGPEYDAEAVRLAGEFPTWSPGKRDGMAKACYQNLPIRFKLPL